MAQHKRLPKSYYNLCRKHGALKGKTPAQASGLSDPERLGEYHEKK